MKRRGLVAVLLVLAAATAGCGEKPAMTAADAREFARRALTRAGLANVEVAPQVPLSPYRSPSPAAGDSQTIEVLQTRSMVQGGEVDLFVQRRGDSAVFVRDTATGGGRLLNDQQFQALQRFRLNLADERQRDRQRVSAFAAAVLVVVAASSLFSVVLSGAADRRPRVHSAKRRRRTEVVE